MGDLISRSELLDVVRYQLDDALHGAELIGKAAFKQKATDCRNFIELIKSMPTIEAVPVVHGEWLEQEDMMLDTYYDCSVCGESFTTIDGTPSDNLFNYCPNCGAKMDGGVKNE